MNWELVKARGHNTVKVKHDGKEYYLHSRYNPIKEATSWVNGLPKILQDKVIVIGLGLGYHIAELKKIYPDLTIHIFEFNAKYVKWMNDNKLISDDLLNEQVVLHFDQDSILDELMQMLNENMENLFIYKPSLELIENKAMKRSLESFHLYNRTILEQSGNLIENFNLNLTLRDKEISNERFNFHDHTCILVSAGPSLTKQLSMLKRVRLDKKIKVICVGTAVIPLLAENIKPDLIMISDPKDNIFKQLEGINTTSIPLVYLSTANHLTVKSYSGERYIAWQKGFQQAEIKAQSNTILIETGGSVATCLLDMLVKLGSKRIGLIGQDLSFTDNYSHAANTHAQKVIQEDYSYIEVKDYYGNSQVKTSKNLYAYLKWFERYASTHQDIELCNCTEGGAYIKGWDHISLREFLNA
ncbi:DUF115 domain-containing protein [Rossellomorea aquimaris]|uniref:motility associated factor glycosyltransferase family protein n=1 Tax=Rossellomorea aquimaris TaxID=189382 RepID=UPI001CD217A8|nr:6-hydroxymethylpterin diphosphokinase MptE-like protein [Rossellomorea aquimaris]MCA1055302.1 DUF115 domain-containing protein [Rossellomorea aquimaris]